jgi:hypothetical protein
MTNFTAEAFVRVNRHVNFPQIIGKSRSGAPRGRWPSTPPAICARASTPKSRRTTQATTNRLNPRQKSRTDSGTMWP